MVTSMYIKIFFLLLIICVQEGQPAKHVLPRQRRGNFRHRHNHVEESEADSWIALSGKSTNKRLSTLNLENDRYSIISENSTRDGGLFPPIFDVAPFANITANATCGTKGSDETFCKLGENMQCNLVCNALSASKKHPISFAIDNDDSNWWQSPTLEQGTNNEYVTITMDLKQEYYIWNVIIKCAISPRPANWILERSIDGTDFSAWQYFAVNEDDCWQRYGVPTAPSSNIIVADNETLCTTAYSKIKPYKNGQIHSFIAKGRPGCVSSCTVINTKELKEFSRARYLRFRFQKFNIPKDKYQSLLDPSFQRSLFYSIKRILVQAQCICHGHSSSCKSTYIMIRPQCECSHNTCGNNCERCCPLYNQKPWKEGTLLEPNVCERCQCHGHAEACRYDAHVDANNNSLSIFGEYKGGGVCINCTKHTTGINCEKCELGWFRPSGERLDSDEPCLPCECHQIGSTGHCIGDEANYTLDGKKAGTCYCLEGFDGLKCDRCAVGFFNFPNCEKCKCDRRGTELSESCEKQCVCKENVEGEICDQCKQGYFHLSLSNSLDCKECYCSGVSDICIEATGYRFNIVHNFTGWLITDITVTSFASPMWNNDKNVYGIFDYDVQLGVDNYYWLAPSEYVGNKLTSYGLALRVSIGWNVMRGDTSGQPVFNPDIIIVGTNGLIIAHGNRNYEDLDKIMLSVRMDENNWYRLPENSLRSEYFYSKLNDEEKVSRREIMSVLSDIKYILLRAKFHTDQIDCSLLEVDLETGIREKNEDKRIVSGIEQCSCPVGYIGLSCEKCNYGYVELQSSTASSQRVCTSCNCNGHSRGCDLVTKQCHVCEHNTTGPKCEFCQEGFYGNAIRGTPEDCNLCACPLIHPSNNFSPTCILKSLSSKEYICDKCAIGYAGSHCEICAEGYFGNPMEIGSKCIPCDCNGNPCNPSTGQCLSCEGNSEGWYCERCKIGYFGNPENKNCSKCDCNPVGSKNGLFCDIHSGQCLCKMNYVGRTCDRCLDGFGDSSSGCIPCNCNILGSESEICDSKSGYCFCKHGVTGRYCDHCEKMYFGFESGSGCEKCNCHKVGSVNEDCDPLSGTCSCRNNVIGRTCSQCQDSFWNLSKNGCEPCNCDDIGSLSKFCDQVTGKCTCKYGVSGLKCDRCLENFYGFSKFGCFECEPCDKPGHICDIHSGRCICPFGTEGLYCDRCIAGTWSHNPVTGCQECHCNKHGSKSSECDFIMGKCDCNVGYSGEKCHLCAPGYYGFPKCRPCSCNPSGSDPDTCFDDHCLCDSKGQCYCKMNTTGKRCDQCKEGTFGLHSDNMEGCTSCFCFGRSTQCSEASLIWNNVKLLPDRILFVRYNISNNATTNFSSSNNYPVNVQEICYVTQYGSPYNVNVNSGHSETGVRLNVTNNLRLIPVYSDVVEIGVNYLFDTPVYWQLPDIFLGDKILSYGGFIEFTTNTEGGSTLLPPSVIASYPLIQIQGNDKFILEYFPPMITLDKHYRVRLHESFWKQKNNPTEHVTRDVFMLTLQNLQHILIRASESIDFTKATLADVTMDIAATAKEFLPPTLSVTHEIEICQCPEQYSSSSCQNPSIGYYRYYGNQTTAVSTIIIQIVGEAAPCHCNGLSTVCDINTGECLNCSKNTGGSHCERCADGYYRTEITADCEPCPCPHVFNNHAYSCQIPKTNNEHLICHCEEGYKGSLCDKCNYGYYGYPKQFNGTCVLCNCNKYGIISDECHEETGQCNCKPGITGKDCSICEKKNHILTENACTPCQDPCVQLLLDDIENTTQNFKTETDFVHKKLKPPWHLLKDLDEKCTNVQNIFNSYTASVQKLLLYGNVMEEELKKRVKSSINKIKRIGKYLQNSNFSATDFWSNATMLYKLSTSMQNEIHAIIASLENYIKSGKVDLNLSVIVNEARLLLNNIRELDYSVGVGKTEQTLSYCRMKQENVRGYDNSGPGLDLLNKKVQKLIERVDDVKSITSDTNSLISQVSHYLVLSNDLSHWISNITQLINDVVFEINQIKQEYELLNNGTKQLISETKENIVHVNQSSDRLNVLIRLVEEKEGILQNLNPSYRELFVVPASKHADMLAMHAQHYVSLFVPTKHDADVALKASRAYTNIIDALEDARRAISITNNVLESISNKLHLKSGPDSVVEKAKSMEETSRHLETLAKLEKMDVELLVRQYEYQQKYMESSRNKLREFIRNITSISLQLEDLKNAEVKLKSMNEALIKYRNSTEIPDDLYDTIFSIQDNINDELKAKLIKVQGYGEIGLRPDDESKIKETEDKTLKVVSQLHSARRQFNDRTKYFERWNSSISSQLQMIKNKIEQTRHLANGIHISLCSKSDQELCSRSYQLKDLKPSITNYISITYAVQSHHRDALLFYIASSISGDFLAVEIINRKVRFVWDLGGGPTELIHPLHIQTANDLQKDQHWYKIDVERIGNIGKLSVRPVIVSSGSVLANGNPVMNSSQPGWNRFDVAGYENLWIGGVKKSIPSVLLSKQEGLVGCLYRVSFDKKPIGLWNFNYETSGNCVACTEGIEEIREDNSYFFTGDGYATLRGHSSSVYNKYSFSVSFNLKTYDENSILFYATAAKQQQYLMIIIKEGRIVFQIGYTEDIKLEIKTSNRYMTGNWTHVEATRYYDRKKKIEKGYLKVGSEMKEGFPFPALSNQNDIPDLSTPQYFFGGISPGFISLVPVPQSFLGCMSDLQIMQEEYNPFGGSFWGVQKSCLEKRLTTVGFQGNGYLELASHTLRKFDSFSFVFSTNQENAFLLLSTTEGLGSSESDENEHVTSEQVDKVNYYSISLREGRIEFLVNAGNGDTRLMSRSDTNYSDGQFHSLNIIKIGKRLELRIDDVIQAVGFMEEEGTSTVKAAGKVGGLFFGGVPSDFNLNMSSVCNVPLVGTIKDAIFNDRLISFDHPIEFERALIGHSGPQSLSSDLDITSIAQSIQGMPLCHKPQTYSVEPFAVQFGDSPQSYVRLNYDRQVFHNKNSTIRLMFRTFYLNGILLVIPGADEKQDHHFRLFLLDGKIYASVKSKRRFELFCTTNYADGLWHRVKLMRDGKTFHMDVDNLPSQKLIIPRKLNLMNTVFVGGYSDSLLVFESSLLQMEALKGCIKEVVINGKREDLVGEKAKHHLVGQCFPHAEKGAFFSGDSYSIFAQNYFISTSLKLELEFRTSELSGILMSIAEPHGSPSFSLELARGKIVLNGDTGDRRIFKMEQTFASASYLCDNAWHYVKVTLTEEEVTLHIDNKNKTYWLPDNGHFMKPNTNSPLYIGGVAENATVGTLENRENFKGCIRNIAVGDRKVDWTEFYLLHNVLVSSCPVQ